ncbi:MAG TPA: protein kinase [Ktedonobacterales bacterium]|nr:protein kinase [Ktedonobacterales bacterium]
MAQAPVKSALAPGTIIKNNYRIEKLIGSGGYANVYYATELTFGYERAIKEVTDPDPGVRLQFQLEARLLIDTKHPGIPRGYYLIDDKDRMYLIMEYVQGKDLEEILNDSLKSRRQPLDEKQVLEWAIAVCDALTVLHSLKTPIIHRDIKPANIKITPDGRPVLIDFGLAKLHRPSKNTQAAAQGVSPGFAPPEQYMAKGKTDARTDIYGLGATIYACLTGRDAPEAPARLLAQTGGVGHGADLKPIRYYNPQVSEMTERIVKKSLELSPQQRPQTAADFQRELRAALNALGGKAADPATAEMGPVCARCGVQNRPGLLNCKHCGAPLDMPGDSLTRGSGKRPAVAPVSPGGRGGARIPAKAPPMAAPAVAHPLADDNRQQTRETLIAAAQRSSKHAAVAAPGARGTAKQPAVGNLPPPSLLAHPGASGVLATDIAGNNALAPRMAQTPANPPAAMLTPAVATPEPATASQPTKKAWIKAGTTPLGAPGKFILAFGFVELLWGALIIALGVMMAVTQNRSFPTLTFAGIWVAIALLASLIGGQAISRPVYRRKRVSGFRRGLQSFGLLLYSVVVHAVAIFGVINYHNLQTSAPVAIIAFVAFGLNVLFIGIFMMLNMLNN